MAYLEKPTSKESSSHWYTKTGKPAYEIQKKDGSGSRPTTLRDARKYNLLPSVTTIFNIMAKPSLDRWKSSQIIKACKELTQGENESDRNFEARVMDRSFHEVNKAADLGTRIHDAIDFSFDGYQVKEDLKVYVDPVLEYIHQKNFSRIEREEVIVSKVYGYAGRVDFSALSANQYNCIVDFKTRKTQPGVKVTPYDFQSMQIAAYAFAKYGTLDNVYGANIYISSTEPGRTEIVSYDSNVLKKDFKVFLSMLNIWKYLNNYNPGENE